LTTKVTFIKLKSHLCKMSSQSNERRIKQFLLFFKIPESFSFSTATVKQRRHIILTLPPDVKHIVVIITVQYELSLYVILLIKFINQYMASYPMYLTNDLKVTGSGDRHTTW